MTNVALITGAAKRIGASVASYLHSHNYNIICHYGQSQTAAQQLVDQLNHHRENSAVALCANFNEPDQVTQLAIDSLQTWGKINVLINNASSFFPTEIGYSTEYHWQDLFNSNVKAGFFLSQALKESLEKEHGSIINMVDIHAQKPLKSHTIYCMAKSALAMMTQSLAKELAPNIRVNGIAPGAILWPENIPKTPETEQDLVRQIPLNRMGSPKDICKAIHFLLQSDYITGQILAVDGGRSL